MTEIFTNAKNRSKSLYANFYKYLEDFCNEEKCNIITEVANKLMEKGSKEDIFAADTILVYATQHYLNDCDGDVKARLYYTLGLINELYTDSFIKAYTYYEKFALNNTQYEGVHSILLRALILRDNFQYSEELEKEYRYSLSEYNLGTRNDRLYEHLGALIIAKNENNEERQQELTKKLKTILKGDDFFFLDYILTKDKDPQRLSVPRKVKEYINAL